ncbi:hypothetical protein COZ81_02590 [Candidatus Jorgensenbacteria bacterium CG_4_8_14_3_um_filter_38_10]|nr:MAG: hypothetical protein COS46_00225 [Candidatus Jorgensenbacteria bacterium CG03_land_8_20_14_0_80_38_39]PIW97423.1 MAG: hypothetical protein COZ81_02590 [Candidatus Jorgensenbacteria bacterium CG_4_8_14_3_um_filter_38_10]PJA95179.1 MAG: hypothetical protein CO130_00485 [Candidatus Jorgensenbacteria bacterium CG_4_9_14_3_um_filter_38_10]
MIYSQPLPPTGLPALFTFLKIIYSFFNLWQALVIQRRLSPGSRFPEGRQFLVSLMPEEIFISFRKDIAVPPL